jgi:hypothetical protein
MEINFKLIFLTFCLFGLSSEEELQCFVPGECSKGGHVDSSVTVSEVKLIIQLYHESVTNWNQELSRYSGTMVLNVESQI